MLSPEKALNIYREWAVGGHQRSQTLIARRYGVTAGTVFSIITAKHTHTKHLPAIHTPKSQATT